MRPERRYELTGENRHIILDYVVITRAKNPVYYYKVVYGKYGRHFNKHIYNLERVRGERDKIELALKGVNLTA